MTGPANFARIITLWMALMVLPLMAHAAAPRDAVKNMPRFTHRSTFETISSEIKTEHSYQENYYDFWTIDWGIPKTDLGTGAWTKFDIHYETKLSDKLRPLTGSSSDMRFDKLLATLAMNTNRGFSASFKLDQQDNFSGQYPSTKARNWNSITTKTVNAGWSRNGLPSLKVAHTLKNTYNYLGVTQTHGSENATTQFSAEYKWQALNEWQTAKVTHQYQRTDTKALAGSSRVSPLSSSSREKHIYDTQRIMSFPHLGKLSMAFHHDEEAKSTGAIEPGKNRNTTYSLALNGGIRDMPVKYGFSYQAQQTGSSNSVENQFVKRQLNLSFSPPVPAGRSAGMNYSHNLIDNTWASRETTTEEQKLSWNIKSNPRTNTTFSYIFKEETDGLSLLRTLDKETLNARINYNIPGGRGSVFSSVNQEVQRTPHQDKYYSMDSLSMGANFILGQGTSLNLLFNQRNDQSRTGLLGLPGGKDEFLSRVTYKTSGRGLSVEAAYEQRHRKNILTEKLTDLESLNVTFVYMTDAAWKYTLKLKTNSQVDESQASAGYDYRTEETIWGEVAYTF